MNDQKHPSPSHLNRREVPQELEQLRLPSVEERREVAGRLNLTPAQSVRLWRAVESMCERFIEHWRQLPQSADERRRLHLEVKQLSRHLTVLEASLAGLSPLAQRNAARSFGPVVAAVLNEAAFWPGQNGPLDAFSIHDLDLLEAEDDADDGEHGSIDRVAAKRFLERVAAFQLQRRQNAGPEEAIRLIRTLLRSLGRPLQDVLELTAGGKGGAPAKRFRNAAVHHLAEVFEEVTGTQPTPTAGGRFVTFCDAILVSIGMETTGLEDAIKRALQDLRS